VSPFEGPLPELPPAWEREQLRKKMGLSITEAARLVKVSRQTFRRWETGATPSPLHQRIYHKLLTEWNAA
jgi:DNA-binding transcriptional regulator YiaG